jgi:hypothetical protein
LIDFMTVVPSNATWFWVSKRTYCFPGARKSQPFLEFETGFRHVYADDNSALQMKRNLSFPALILILISCKGLAIQAPTGLVSRMGDQSIVLHWDRNMETNFAGYRVYRSTTNNAGFMLLNSALLTSPGYCDVSASVANGKTNFYQVTAVSSSAEESLPSVVLPAAAHPFASDNDFLDYIQQVHFDYFWYLANPSNGLVPDRSSAGSACSIAAVGFGLTTIGIGIDHGWITRSQGATRVLATLNTFWQGPQGTNTFGEIGYKGWFYHFLDMNTALTTGAELSSIDTTLLLGGILYAKQYFDGTNADEVSIRSTADAILNRVDWNWMAQGTNVVSMGWFPGAGFIAANWIGYNEGMLLYVLGMGVATNPLPATSWSAWTNGYTWATYYGQSFVPYPPLFTHQYSHCWVDFRHIADSYMNAHGSTYFENSRRATLAQRSYCVANPQGRVGYNGTVWGLTACDGPTGYSARGAPPSQGDDGTIAPTAAGGSIAFTPQYSIPTLQYFYKSFRTRMWTPYGFRDAFNLGASWVGPDELGIDQGPIVIMIENYRTQRVWKLFMRNPEVQRGLQRAGFVPLSSASPRLQLLPSQGEVDLSWDSVTGRTYQVEYSTNFQSWLSSQTGNLTASNSTSSWTDNGPPATESLPLGVLSRFYRVFQFGPQ